MGLANALKVLKRGTTGKVVQQIDTSANGGMTTMSLRLKKEVLSAETYVVLGELTPRNYQYVTFDQDEFARFSQAVQIIRDSLGRR